MGMDPLTIGLIAAGVGGVASGIGARKSAKDNARHQASLMANQRILIPQDIVGLRRDLAGLYQGFLQSGVFGTKPQAQGGGGGGGGNKRELLDNFDLSEQPIPRFQTGGTLGAPLLGSALGLVGENGPELIKNNADGSTDVLPLNPEDQANGQLGGVFGFQNPLTNAVFSQTRETLSPEFMNNLTLGQNPFEVANLARQTAFPAFESDLSRLLGGTQAMFGVRGNRVGSELARAIPRETSNAFSRFNTQFLSMLPQLQAGHTNAMAAYLGNLNAAAQREQSERFMPFNLMNQFASTGLAPSSVPGGFPGSPTGSLLGGLGSGLGLIGGVGIAQGLR